MNLKKKHTHTHINRDKKVLHSSFAQLRRHKPGWETTASNICTAHSTVTGTTCRFQGYKSVYGPLCFWQIYCITSWTAPPVDWRDDPVHIHFYIKFLLLYFFNWNILMCLAFLRLCIKSVLRYLKPCTVWAHSNVLDSFSWPLKGWRHKNASQV